jgi:hypothetical protein
MAPLFLALIFSMLAISAFIALVGYDQMRPACWETSLIDL